MSLASQYGLSPSPPGSIPPARNGSGSGPVRKPSARDASLAQFYRRIEDEITKGLPNERRRLDDAAIQDDFYHERFEAYTSPWMASIDRNAIRAIPVLRAAVDLLTRDLYKDGPARKLPDAEATDWLEQVYRQNAADALWQEADRLACVNQVAAFEVRGTIGPGSERKPIEFDVWGGESLVVWVDPDRPTKPIAVATRDMFDNQRRIRLWTPAERITYVTDKLQPYQTAGGTAFRLQSREPNHYGVIPFAFVHFRYPASSFWNGSPGRGLRMLNDHVNYRLSVIADDILHGRPIGVIEGAAAGWNFPKDIKRGMFTAIPAAMVDAAGSGNDKPEAKYVTCDFGYLGSDREELQEYLDTVLALDGIPSGAVRLKAASSVGSGVAIVLNDELPILKWAESRQNPFGFYEKDLAQITFAVAAAHARHNERADLLGLSVATMEALAEDCDLTLKWKSLLGPILATQRKDWYAFQLDYQLMSKTQVVQELRSCDRDEAEAHVAQAAADIERERTLFAEPAPPGMEGMNETVPGGPAGGEAPPAEAETETASNETGES